MSTQKKIEAPFDPSRPPLREASSAERAALRAAEVREHLGGGGMDEGTDEFYIDRTIIPDGWDYEWKMQQVMGKEDPAYAVGLARKGWEPVPASRHPALMPHDSQERTITRKGMVLMERPMELTIEARAIEARRAQLQVRAKEDQLNAAPAGQFERQNKDASLIKVKKGYAPAPIPVPSDAG